jgi:hypothetical protein
LAVGCFGAGHDPNTVAGDTSEVEKSAGSALKLGEGSVLVFADVNEGRNVLTARDAFVKALSPFDRSARLKTDKNVSEKEFLEYVAKQVLPWSEDDKRRLSPVIESLAGKLARFKLKFPEKILLIKTTGAEEGRATYTRSGAIVIPQNRLLGDAGHLEVLFIHELFHILTASNPDLKEALYGVIHFEKCNEIELPEKLRDIKITNPDAPNNDHYVEVRHKGERFAVVPFIYSSSPKYDVNRGGEFFQYLTFNLMVVENSDAKWHYKRGADGKAVLLEPRDVGDYANKLGLNTGYIIHPEEVLAENFVLLVQGHTRVKSKWVLEKMEKVLLEYSNKEKSKTNEPNSAVDPSKVEGPGGRI